MCELTDATVLLVFGEDEAGAGVDGVPTWPPALANPLVRQRPANDTATAACTSIKARHWQHTAVQTDIILMYM